MPGLLLFHAFETSSSYQYISSLAYRSSGSLIRGLVDVLLKLIVSLVEIIIDNDLVMNTRSLGKLKFIVRLVQSLLDTRLVLGTTATETCFQGLERRRSNKNIPSSDAGLLNLLDPLLFKSACAPQSASRGSFLIE